MRSIFSESKIFKNERVLSSEYLPEWLPHREDKIKQLATNLAPLSKGKIGQDSFIFGPPGIGKTHVTKFVFRELEEFSSRTKTIYINCWDYNTTHSILSKIALELQVFVQRRGLGKDEILEKVIEGCKKIGKELAICLDEVDQLILKDQKALYDLLRLNQYIDNQVCLVLISNDKNAFLKVDPRIRSSLNVEEIEFKPYSLLEMKDILNERAKLAFYSVEPGVVLLAANRAVKLGGDVRIGLECLLKAGRLAENQNADMLKVEHVKKILPTVKPIKPQIIKERVSEDGRIVLDILEKVERLSSGHLYEEYRKRVENPLSERAFRDLINRLWKSGAIKVKEKTRGIRGRTRIISKA